MKSRVGNNGNYQWLNTKSFGLPHGLGIGGTLEGFRLFISESFENCRASESCLCFEPGKLLPDNTSNDMPIMDNNGLIPPMNEKYNFEIDCLEVWACGGNDMIQKGMKAQAKEREIKNESIEKARKVDKAQFFNNAFDREFLLSGTFAHKEQQSDDRCS